MTKEILYTYMEWANLYPNTSHIDAASILVGLYKKTVPKYCIVHYRTDYDTLDITITITVPRVNMG